MSPRATRTAVTNVGVSIAFVTERGTDDTVNEASIYLA